MAPRMYLALDASFTSSAAIEELGETHGAAGPMVILSLLCLAKQQGQRGAVRTTRKKLAAEAFIASPEDAWRIVAHALALGVLEEPELEGGIELHERAIFVRFPRWGSWQVRAAEADRKAAYRATQRAGSNGTSTQARDELEEVGP